ncbi:MAG: nucleotidyltransferase family protein [Acidimicrobiales bacterium]
MTVAGVVLAAGAGDRFTASDHKLLADFRGRPLVTWAVAAAVHAAALDEVFVVVGAVELGEHLPAEVIEVHNPEWASGQASSVRTGVAEARRHGHDAVVIGLGDAPLVPSSAWDAVARVTGDIVTATFAGRRRPPTKLHSSVWDELATEGDEGARALFRRWPDRVREVACEGDPVDIDTLEDLAQWN